MLHFIERGVRIQRNSRRHCADGAWRIALTRRYSELHLPVVIMAGAGDLIASVGKHAKRLVEEIDASELRIVPDQGHTLHYGTGAGC